MKPVKHLFVFLIIMFGISNGESRDYPDDFLAEYGIEEDTVPVLETIQEDIEQQDAYATLTVTPMLKEGVSVRPKNLFEEQNDVLVFQIESPKDGYLTLIDIRPDLELSVLIPNSFNVSEKIDANQPVHFPSGSDPFRFRASKPLGESIIWAVVSSSPLDVNQMKREETFSTLLGADSNKLMEYLQLEINGIRSRGDDSVWAITGNSKIQVFSGSSFASTSPSSRSLAQAKSTKIPKEAIDLCRQAIQAKDPKDKLKFATQAAAIAPKFAFAHNEIGNAYQKMGEFEKSIGAYKTAWELDRTKAVHAFGLGDSYFELGGYADSVEWYENGLRIDPKDKLSQKKLVEAEKHLFQDAEELTRSFQKPRTRGAAPSANLFIRFELGSAELRPDDKKQLDEFASVVKNTEPLGFTFEIQGHTCTRGSADFNKKLSNERAQAVFAYLTKEKSCTPGRLEFVGFGEEKLHDKKNPESASNRRVTVKRLK